MMLALERSCRRRAGWLLAVLLVPALASGQAVSDAERASLARQVAERGGEPADLDVVMALVDDAAADGLPSTPLTNKVREGLAKGVAIARIAPVVRQMIGHLSTADALLAELRPAPARGDGSRTAVATLAESLAAGVTPDEVRELSRRSADAVAVRTAEGLASAARGLAFIKDAALPVSAGTDVVAEAVRQGFDDYALVDLGREVKRRETDYQVGRLTLTALREAIARGERPERLFDAPRPEPVERPAVTRPGTVERPERPEPPTRPEPVERPAVPERPGAR